MLTYFQFCCIRRQSNRRWHGWCCKVNGTEGKTINEKGIVTLGVIEVVIDEPKKGISEMGPSCIGRGNVDVINERLEITIRDSLKRNHILVTTESRNDLVDSVIPMEDSVIYPPDGSIVPIIIGIGNIAYSNLTMCSIFYKDSFRSFFHGVINVHRQHMYTITIHVEKSSHWGLCPKINSMCKIEVFKLNGCHIHDIRIAAA
mmetsp:Transcript_31596/g.48030  ORF Transcript_31596/g.48030 Transcript_31596/m.48030 type:complete len:202 (+) Transcript_31596:1531-2136(+)